MTLILNSISNIQVYGRRNGQLQHWTHFRIQIIFIGLGFTLLSSCKNPPKNPLLLINYEQVLKILGIKFTLTLELNFFHLLFSNMCLMIFNGVAPPPLLHFINFENP